MTRLSAYGLPELPRIGAAASRRKEPRLELTPEEEESVAKKAGRIALGGIAAVGNLLDLPGSSVRDLLAGENPLDQWLHPLSGEKRVYGRDLLRKAGMIGSQDNWKNWLGGLAVDIATDPLTYVFPVGTATRAGQVAKAAGLGADVIPTAARRLGKPVSAVGKREAAVTTKLGDLLAAGGKPAQEAAEKAAQGLKIDLRSVADEPLRGMFGLGVLGKPMWVGGTGERAQKFARALDKIGMGLGKARIPGTEIQPFNALYRTFSAPIGETRTRTGQVFHRQMFEGKNAATAEARQEIAGYIDELKQAGHATDEEADLFRAWVENVQSDPVMLSGAHRIENVPPKLQGLVGRLQQRQADILADQARWGVDPDAWTSPYAKHWTRHLTEMPEQKGVGRTGGYSSFGTVTPEAEGRLSFLQPYTDKQGATHAIHGETWTIKKLVQDEKLWDMQDKGIPRGQRASYIRKTYGDLIPDKYEAVTKKGVKLQNRYLALTKWLEKMDPDLRATGMFGNHPLVDFQAQLVNANDAIKASQAVRDLLVSPEILQPADAALRETVALKDVLRGLKIKPGDINEGFGKRLAEGLGIDIDTIAKGDPAAAANQLDALMNMRVSREIGADLLRFRKPFESPQPVHEILQAFDKATNLFKGSVTSPWPAFHVRNFFSGQFQNYAAGMFSLRSVKDTWNLLRGKTLEGAAEIPAIKQMAAAQGIRHLTDEQATNMVGQLIYAQGLSHRFQGEALNVAGGAAEYGPASLAATMQEIPGYGVGHIQPGRIGRKFIAQEPGTSFNPLRTRGGFYDDIQSKFGPVAAGEETAGVIESFNRISPFLHQLRQGVDPTAAATKVGAAQVLYQSKYYTAAERQVFKRLFPFYSFSSRVLPWTIRQLAEKPSGRLAQTIRATNRMRNPDVMTPDYVAETMSVPMGSTPEGGQRYLTGLGLMHEDPTSFLGGGVRGALLETGSRMNPFLKAPLEWMTGQTFFQKGPMGGRALEDLDPTIGRTLANLMGRKEAVRLPQGVEFLAQNSPLARVLTTARTATYPIRAMTDPMMRGELIPEALRTAANLGTGMRVSTVSPAAQDTLLRERVDRMMRGQGAKTFVKTYIPEEVEAQMTPEELADAQKLEALMNTLVNRGKARKEARKKAEARK